MNKKQIAQERIERMTTQRNVFRALGWDKSAEMIQKSIDSLKTWIK